MGAGSAIESEGAAINRDGRPTIVTLGPPAETARFGFALRAAYAEGIDIRAVHSVAEALLALDSMPADAILADLHHVGGAAADAIARLGAAHPSVAIVLVAEESDGQDLATALDRGAHESIWRAEVTTPELRRTLTKARERAHTDFVERRMARFMERTKEVVVVFGPDGRPKYVSTSFEALTGFAITEANWSELPLTHPDDLTRVADTLARVSNGDEEQATLEYRGGNADGSWRWREMTAINLLDDPLVRGVVVTFRDIDDRRRADAIIRFHSQLLASIGQPVVATDNELVVRFWNQAAVDLYGWTAEEAIGRPIKEVTSTERGWNAIAAVARSQMEANQDSWSADVWLCRKDGSEFPARVSNTRLVDGEGRLTGNIGVTTDLSERFQHEAMRSRLSSIVESSIDAVVSLDLDGTIASWNRAAELLHGLTADRVLGRCVDDVAPDLGAGLAALRRGDRLDRLHVTTHTDDVPRRHTSHYHSPIEDAAGAVVGVAVVSRDITEQVELIETLERDRRHLADAQHTAHVGSFEINRVTGELSWSDELYDILGVPRGTEVTTETYWDRIHPDDRALMEPDQTSTSLPDERFEVVHRMVRTDGAIRWVAAHGVPGTTDDVVHGTVHDITDVKEAELELAHQARHDALTDLPNRSWMTHRLGELMESGIGPEGHVTLALLDLDQFKTINDNLGHSAGDHVLQEVAARISAACADSDIVGRFGGDEFVVARSGTGSDADDAHALGTLLCEALVDPILVDERSFNVTASIGITTSRADDTPDCLLRDADSAMYEAKARGKNRFVYLDAGLRAQAQRRIDIETDLRVAVRDDALDLHFQPVIDLASGRVAGFEALARWTHPTYGTIEPAEFVAVAEGCGLILPIGDWVLRTAATQLGHWRRDGIASPRTWVAVNLSARQLATPDLAQRVERILRESGLPPANLHVEITESVLMDDVTHSLDMTRALHALGVPISIDDFGTGYSSLSYLKRLPVSTLKVDRSFVAGIGTDPQDTAIVTTIVELAHSLGLEVVAEGVETPAQLDTLRALGAEHGQGFIWSQAVPAAYAADWLVRDLERANGAAALGTSVVWVS